MRLGRVCCAGTKWGVITSYSIHYTKLYDKLPLHVDGEVFAKSVHSRIGCPVCHASTSFENHPPVKRKIAGAREYSLEMNKICQSCHEPIVKQYEGSIHASLFRESYNFV